MKISTRIIIIAAAFFAAANAYAQDVTWEWKDVAKNAQYTSVNTELFGSMQCISVFRYKLKKYDTQIVNDPGLDKSIPSSTTTTGFAERYDALAAINGSYFNVKTLYPTTYVRDDGVKEGMTTPKELPRVNGVMGIKGHKIMITECDTLSYEKALRGYYEGMAAGPVLIEKGVVKGNWPKKSFYTGHHPRTFIGTDAKGWAYLVVIDGRFEGQAKGMTIEETAEVARMLGMRYALNLDGGGSSTLWIKGMGVVSHPYDNQKFDHEGERIVPNAVVVK